MTWIGRLDLESGLFGYSSIGDTYCDDVSKLFNMTQSPINTYQHPAVLQASLSRTQQSHSAWSER
jgi:hypothetical protein